MNHLSKIAAVAAALLLACCASSAHRSATAVRSCETAIYVTPDADDEAALDCARLLDIWR